MLCFWLLYGVQLSVITLLLRADSFTSDPGTDARSDRPYLYFSQSSQKATKSWHWPGNQCSSVSVQRVNVHIVDAVNSIVWQKLLRVLNLRKTSIIYTVSSLDKTSDISKLEQFHISDIYLDCKGAKVLHITAWMQIRVRAAYVQSV